MNIAQITRRFVRHEWGGVETAVIQSCKELARLGHTCKIVTSAALSHPGKDVVHGVPVERFRHMYPYWGLSAAARLAMDKKGGNLFSLSLLRSLQGARDLDLLHTHTLNRLGGIVRYVAKQRRLPYIVSIHGGVHDLPQEQADLLAAPSKGTLEWGKLLGWWFGSRQVLSDADAIVCFGRTEWELTRQRYPNTRVRLMPHGVDVAKFSQGDGSRVRKQHNLPPNARVMLCLARIDPQKNQRLAIACLPAILDEHPDVHLVLMGPVTDPAYHAELQRAAAEHGVQTRVVFAEGAGPESDELLDAFQAADMFVLPSMHEVFGIVVLEAWAAGVPVVATKVGGIKSLVHDGKDGLLLDHNDEAAFVQHCNRLLGAPETAERIRLNARIRVEQEFSWRSVTRQLADLYEEVKREHAHARQSS